jgi:hypothetical protein
MEIKPISYVIIDTGGKFENLTKEIEAGGRL